MKEVKLPIAYAGDFKGHPQGAFSLSLSDIDKLIESGIDRDIPIDIEHKSLKSDEYKIYGRVKRNSMYREGDKLYGTAEIDDDIADGIKKGNLSYISPVIQWNKKENHDGNTRDLWLYNLALTNRPFMYKNKPITIANSELFKSNEEGEDMPQEIIALFSEAKIELNDEQKAKVEELENEIEKLRANSEELAKLKAENNELKANGETFTKIATEFKAMSEQIASLKAENAEAKTRVELANLQVIKAKHDMLISIRANSDDSYQKIITDLPIDWVQANSAPIAYEEQNDMRASSETHSQAAIDKSFELAQNAKNMSPDEYLNEMLKVYKK